jgi:hypothetical protein
MERDGLNGHLVLRADGSFTYTPAGGTVTFYADGLFYYRAPAGFAGVDSFEYVPVDRYGAEDVGEVTIGVGLPA